MNKEELLKKVRSIANKYDFYDEKEALIGDLTYLIEQHMALIETEKAVAQARMLMYEKIISHSNFAPVLDDEMKSRRRENERN